MKYHFTAKNMAKTRKGDSIKCKDVEQQELAYTEDEGTKLGHPLWNSVWKEPLKLNTCVSRDPTACR